MTFAETASAIRNLSIRLSRCVEVGFRVASLLSCRAAGHRGRTKHLSQYKTKVNKITVVIPSADDIGEVKVLDRILKRLARY